MSTIYLGPCKLYYGDDSIYLGYTKDVEVNISPTTFTSRIDQHNYNDHTSITYKKGTITATLLNWDLCKLGSIFDNATYDFNNGLQTLSFSNTISEQYVSTMKSLVLESLLDDNTLTCKYVYPQVNLDTVFQKDTSGFGIIFNCYWYNNEFMAFT